MNSQIAPHLIRMAETRAKARALRDAINASAIPFEELADTGDAGAHLRAQGGGGSSPRPPPIRSAPSGGASGRRSGQDGGQVSAGSGDFPSRAREPKARKSQVDLLKTLAIEWRGEGGVERLEGRIGKKLASMSRREADEWIERLTPEDKAEGGSERSP